MTNNSPYRGFTFLELIIALGIASILILGINFYVLDFYRLQTLRSYAFELSNSLRKAHLTAIAQKAYITLLPLENSWQKGWVSFEDKNHNSILDANETILDKVIAPAKGITSSKNNLSCVTFNPVGLTNRCSYAESGLSGMLSNGTISFNFGADATCKKTVNLILNRSIPKICLTTKKSENGCVC